MSLEQLSYLAQIVGSRRLMAIVSYRSKGRYVRAATTLILCVSCCACTQLPYTDIPDPFATHPKAVVFDIDGTLTPDVSAPFGARKDASDAVRAYAEKGYQVVYLSTRVSWLSAGIPAWLKENGFPAGSIHVAQTRDERRQPEAYKTGVLRAYIAHGWKLEYAYGDSSTDLAAYAAAGVPEEHVFVLLRRGDSSCQPGLAAVCLHDWSEHLAFISTSVANAKDD